MSIELFPQATLQKSDASLEKSDHIVKSYKYIRGVKFCQNNLIGEIWASGQYQYGQKVFKTYF